MEIAGLNTDLQQEYARQREHLERNLATLKKKVVKESELHRTDYVRIMQVPPLLKRPGATSSLYRFLSDSSLPSPSLTWLRPRPRAPQVFPGAPLLTLAPSAPIPFYPQPFSAGILPCLCPVSSRPLWPCSHRILALPSHALLFPLVSHSYFTLICFAAFHSAT